MPRRVKPLIRHPEPRAKRGRACFQRWRPRRAQTFPVSVRYGIRPVSAICPV